jgi:hypothetical protein
VSLELVNLRCIDSADSPPVYVKSSSRKYSGRIKSLDPATRTGVVIVAARSGGRKIFGLATLSVRFR